MAGVAETNPQLEPRRACQECNRKKTKCDMRRPVCGLCLRTGNTCSFPSKRKKPVSRKPQLKAQTRKINDSLSKLVEVLEKASRADGESEAANNAHEISSTLLKDSLKDLLVEIRTSEDQLKSQNAATSEPAGTRPSASEGDDVDLEDESIETDDVGLSQTDPDTSKAEPAASATTPDADNGVSSSLAVDLVNTFFEKVQPWLPLLHRPRFQARYEGKLLVAGDFMKGLSQDECLLFYSMFAMSARFSTHHRFHSTPPEKRGQIFAERAKDVYVQSRSLKTPSLMYLQGCILLAFYFYTSGPTYQGWLLIGVCVRMAYDLA